MAVVLTDNWSVRPSLSRKEMEVEGCMYYCPIPASKNIIHYLDFLNTLLFVCVVRLVCLPFAFEYYF